MSASDTINTTAVVHEAYEKLLGRNIDFNDRRHFFGIASRAMRDVLVDYARSKGAQKRGGDVSTSSLQEGLEVADEPPLRIEEVLSLDAALTELSGFDAMSAQIVELRYFVGLANEEIGVILGVSERTVKRRWTAARAWLYRRLSDDV